MELNEENRNGCIRIAAIADLERLTNIYNQSIFARYLTCDTDPFTVQERQSWFNEHKDKKYPLYVYEVEGKVVGYVYLSPYRSGRKALSHVCEVSYYLDFDYHGRRIGSLLLEHAIQTARQMGFRNMIAILLESNLISIKLLKKYGFSEWGNMPDIAEFEEVSYAHLYFGKKL